MLRSKFEQILKKESVKLKIGQLMLFSLRNKVRKQQRKLNRAMEHHQAKQGPKRREEDKKDNGRNNGRKLPKADKTH